MEDDEIRYYIGHFVIILVILIISFWLLVVGIGVNIQNEVETHVIHNIDINILSNYEYIVTLDTGEKLYYTHSIYDECMLEVCKEYRLEINTVWLRDTRVIESALEFDSVSGEC